MNVWEANEKVMELETKLAHRDNCIEILIEQSLGKSKRLVEVMSQNDELSDRIHLDLDPRVARLTAQLALREEIIVSQDERLEAIRLLA